MRAKKSPALRATVSPVLKTGTGILGIQSILRNDLTSSDWAGRLSGLAISCGRGEQELKEWVALDLTYVFRHCL